MVAEKTPEAQLELHQTGCNPCIPQHHTALGGQIFTTLDVVEVDASNSSTLAIVSALLEAG